MKVEKIGRRWATVSGRYDGDRIDLETLYMDGRGFSSAGRCWLTRGEYEASLGLGRAWHALQQRMSGAERHRDGYWLAPEGMTVEQISQAEAILFPDTKA